MRLSRGLVLCLAPVLALASPCKATAAIYVAGDSLGVGVGWAGHAPSLAKNSVAIRSKVVLAQIAKVPAGSTIFLSLGTNDAVGKSLKVDAAVEAIVAAAEARRIRIVWMGPPCVFKPWDKNAAALDRRLSALLARHDVTYVSMRDPSLCTRGVRARDGVHFNMTGYKTMWDKAVAAADGRDLVVPAAFESETPAPAQDVVGSIPADVPLPRLRPGRVDEELVAAGAAAEAPTPVARLPAPRPLPQLVGAVDRQALLRSRFADAFLSD